MSQVYYQPQQPKPTYPGRNQAIASMVLGIVAWALVMFSFGILSPVSFVLSAIGLPLAIIAYKKVSAVLAPKGVTIAGIVLNGAGMAIAALLFFLVALTGVAATISPPS